MDSKASHKRISHSFNIVSMNSIRHILAKNIAGILLSKDMSAADLRRLAKMPHTTLNNIINARASATIDNVKIIADALGVPIGALLDERPERYSNEAFELLDKYQVADESGRYALKIMADQLAHKRTAA